MYCTNNPRISALWSTTKSIESFSCTPRVQEVHTKAEIVHLTTGLLGLGVLFNCHAYEMYCNINTRIPALWSTTKQIELFSCTPCVQEVHTKPEVEHLTPGLLGLGVLFNCHAWEIYCEAND